MLREAPGTIPAVPIEKSVRYIPGRDLSDHPVSLRESWEARAQDWIDWVRAPGHPDSYWRFHREEFFALLPQDPGDLTVDIGCGEGRVSRDLQARGHKVLGIDCSETMIQAAADHKSPAPAIRADAARLPLADASADCAIAFMSLQDIDDMPAAISEAARVLRDARHFVIAIVHPMYSRIEVAKNGNNPDKLFVIKGSYFDQERRKGREARDGLTMTFDREHRPLQAYTDALTDAGFIIEKMCEVTEPDETQPRHCIPMFLGIRATRKAREETSNCRDEPRTARGKRHLRIVGPPRQHASGRRGEKRSPHHTLAWRRAGASTAPQKGPDQSTVLSLARSIIAQTYAGMLAMLHLR